MPLEKEAPELTDSGWTADKSTARPTSGVPSPDLLPQRHGSTCQATYPPHSWCLVTLRELLSPPCNQHIPEHLGIFHTQIHCTHFREQRTGAYKRCLSRQHGNVLAYLEREPHSAFPWGPGEDLAWHPFTLWASHIFSSFQITQGRYSRWLENITQRNVRLSVRGLGRDRGGS